MQVRGYDHPLYSLELVPCASTLVSGARHSLEAPGGRLAVRPQLLGQARHVTVAACAGAVAAGDGLRSRAREAFAAYGLSEEWQDHMYTWRDRMAALHRERRGFDVGLRDRRPRRQALLAEGRRLWLLLRTSATLAGVADLVLRGAAPRAEAALAAGLLAAAKRAAEHAGPLAQFGFGSRQLAMLRALLVEMSGCSDRCATELAAQRRLGEDCLVIRAALIGDLRRLCQTAPAVLGPRGGAGLEQLLGVRRAERRKAAPAPPPPGEDHARALTQLHR